MEIKVRIETKNEFDTISVAVSESLNLDAEIVTEGTSTLIEMVMDNIYGALISLGYHENTVKKYIKR